MSAIDQRRLQFAARRSAALAILRDAGDLIVALSGGVDSAVLLWLALEALGRGRVLAVTGRSPSLPAADLEDAKKVARFLRARHEVVETREMERPGYLANAGSRCYHCRKELFEVLAGLARERGFRHVAYGAIRDDLGDFRPGMRAAEEHRVLAPLLAAGMTKQDVRRLAGLARLEVRDKPAAACLSSRIPVGVAITRDRLGRVERAEAALLAMGFRQVRVRYHGEVARVELDPEGIDSLLDRERRSRAVDAIRAAGFRYVTLDLEGYRTGSLNPEHASPDE